ncbi:hypothetical protein [Marinicella sp. W31]|uniref:hypothetical protein n=1 Tax=Marinicella sp. W31 TaxID=3023713 RepID=UPI003758062E
MKKLSCVLLLAFCLSLLSCSQHKLYVIGATETQLKTLSTKLSKENIKVISKPEIKSEFETLTLISAVSFPVDRVESVIDDSMRIKLVHGSNHFYTDSAGLYFPISVEKAQVSYADWCNGYFISLIHEESNFTLKIEKLNNTGSSWNYDLVDSYQGHLTIQNANIQGFVEGGSLFLAELFYDENIHQNSIVFLQTNILQLAEQCSVRRLP